MSPASVTASNLAEPAHRSRRRRLPGIRLNYFSADFREHPVSYLSAELFELHDRGRLEVFGFSYGSSPEDAARGRLRTGFDRFLEVAGRSDRDIAAAAQELEIDIAIDLGGHTGQSRPGILGHCPAPTRVHFLGYPGTLGAPFVDYLIADPIVIPEEHRRFYTEKIAYLPDTCQVNDRQSRISERAFTRGELGLPDDGFVFCCFNNNHKISGCGFVSASTAACCGCTREMPPFPEICAVRRMRGACPGTG